MSSSAVAVEEDTACGSDSTVIDEAVQLMVDSQRVPQRLDLPRVQVARFVEPEGRGRSRWQPANARDEG